MNNIKKFEIFLKSLKGKSQDVLIESIRQGFQACMESDIGYGESPYEEKLAPYAKQRMSEEDSMANPTIKKIKGTFHRSPKNSSEASAFGQWIPLNKQWQQDNLDELDSMEEILSWLNLQ